MKRISDLNEGKEMSTWNAKPEGEGVYALKFRGGQKGEWRIYYTKVGDDFVILNAGTSKKKNAQSADIEEAQHLREQAVARIHYAQAHGQDIGDVFRPVNTDEFVDSVSRRNSRTSQTTAKDTPTVKVRPSDETVSGQPGGSSDSSRGQAGRTTDILGDRQPIRFPAKAATASTNNTPNDGYAVDGNTVRKPLPQPSTGDVTMPAAPGSAGGKPPGDHGFGVHSNPNPQRRGPVLDENGKPMAPFGLDKPALTPSTGETTARGVGGAIQAGAGIGGMIRHGPGFGHNAKDTIGAGLGAANAGFGGASVIKTIAPEMLSEGFMRGVEKAAWPLIIAQGVYDVSTAKPEDRERVAAETVVAGATGGIMMGVVGGTGGAALAILAPMAITYGIENGIALNKLDSTHQKAMNAIEEDPLRYSTLQNEANRLQGTIQDAEFGDKLTQKNGRVDINDEANLAKIKATLSPEQLKQLHDDAATHLKEYQKETDQRERLVTSNRYSTPQDYEELENRRKLDQAHFEQLQLKAAAYNIQMSRDERDQVIHDRHFALGPDGNPDINDKTNRAMLSDMLAQESNIAKQVIEKTPVGELDRVEGNRDKIQTNYAAAEDKKRLDTALSEINQMENGMHGRAKKTDQQLDHDRELLEKSGQTPVEYNVYVNRKFGSIQNYSKVKPTDPEITAEIAEKYDRQHAAAAQDQSAKVVIYRDDGQGNQVPDHLVIYKFNERDLNKASEDPALSYSPVRNPTLPPAEPASLQAKPDAPLSAADKARQQAQAAVSGMSTPVQYGGDHQTAAAYIPVKAGRSAETGVST